MNTFLSQFRLLMAVILLIAGGAVADLAGQASTMGVGPGVTTDIATPDTSALHKAMDHQGPTSHRASCDNFGCCSASIVAGERGVLHDAPVSFRFTAGKAVLASGIDPEALLQPPQILA